VLSFSLLAMELSIAFGTREADFKKSKIGMKI
jgi:hypothetical protein